MKIEIFTITVISAFITLTYPVAASESRLTEKFRALVTRGDSDSVKRQSLHSTALRIDLAGEIVREVIAETPADEINTQNENGYTALGIAIRCNNREFVQQLLAHTSIEPNFPDATGKTPLIIAIKMGRIECIRALLAHPRTNLDIPDLRGNTPAHYAAVAGLPKKLRYALLTCPYVNYDHQAATLTRTPRSPVLPPEIQQAIVSRADLSRANINFNTPIHIAAQRRDIDLSLVQPLVETASGKRAIHTFNANGLLACDLAKKASSEVKNLITPYFLTRCYLRFLRYFSMHPTPQYPTTVTFDDVAATPRIVGQVVTELVQRYELSTQTGAETVGRVSTALVQGYEHPTQTEAEAVGRVAAAFVQRYELSTQADAEAVGRVTAALVQRYEYPTQAGMDAFIEAFGQFVAAFVQRYWQTPQAIGQAVGESFGQTIEEAFGKAVAQVATEADKQAVLRVLKVLKQRLLQTPQAIGEAIGGTIGQAIGEVIGGTIGQAVGESFVEAVEQVATEADEQAFLRVLKVLAQRYCRPAK